jgi:hypothetical protein
MPSLGARIGEYVRTESGFRRTGTLGFGTLAGLGLLGQLGAHGALGWWLFLVALAYGAGWLWAYLMWQFMKGDIERISAKIEEARKARQSVNNEPHST